MYNRQLIGYLPPVVSAGREYQAITHSEQPEIDDLFVEIQTALDNQFVHTATEYGVKRWEKILNIMPKATQTLDERKAIILMRLSELSPYTYRALERMLTALCGEDGYRLRLRHEIYELNVLLELITLNLRNAVETMLRRVVPANLITAVLINYNRYYIFEPFTYEFMENYTYDELRTTPFRWLFDLHDYVQQFIDDEDW